MGREAACRCCCGADSGEVKLLLEGGEVIVRGALKLRLARTELKEVSAKGDSLILSDGKKRVSFALGHESALRWKQAILKPPPSLAKKLGILPGLRVKLVGELDDESLKEALAEATIAKRGQSNLIVVRVNTPVELEQIVNGCRQDFAAGVPVWVVYPKGPAQLVTESDLRKTLLPLGLVDTKVSAVSSKLTALRFCLRQAARKPLG